MFTLPVPSRHPGQLTVTLLPLLPLCVTRTALLSAPARL